MAALALQGQSWVVTEKEQLTKPKCLLSRPLQKFANACLKPYSETWASVPLAETLDTQYMVCKPAALVSPGHLLEMLSHRPNPGPTKLESAF